MSTSLDCLGRLKRHNVYMRIGGNREISPFFCPTSWNTSPLFTTFLQNYLEKTKTLLTFASE